MCYTTAMDNLPQLARDLAPWCLGLAPLALLLWALAPLALHWAHRKRRPKVEDVMRTWPKQ